MSYFFNQIPNKLFVELRQLNLKCLSCGGISLFEARTVCEMLEQNEEMSKKQ